MPVYEYRCRKCGNQVSTTEHLEGEQLCSQCGHRLGRVFSFGIQRTTTINSHFNHSLGRVISSERHLRDELARASEAATERTGVNHNYQPLDYRDPSTRETLGITDEGLKESHDVRVLQGKLDPTPKLR